MTAEKTHGSYASLKSAKDTRQNTRLRALVVQKTSSALQIRSRKSRQDNTPERRGRAEPRRDSLQSAFSHQDESQRAPDKRHDRLWSYWQPHVRKFRQEAQDPDSGKEESIPTNSSRRDTTLQRPRTSDEGDQEPTTVCRQYDNQIRRIRLGPDTT